MSPARPTIHQMTSASAAAAATIVEPKISRVVVENRLGLEMDLHVHRPVRQPLGQRLLPLEDCCRAPPRRMARCETGSHSANASGTRRFPPLSTGSRLPLPPLPARRPAEIRRYRRGGRSDTPTMRKGASRDSCRTSSTLMLTWTKRRPLRRARLTEARAPSPSNRARTRFRSMRARGSGSRSAPRRATSDATDAFTFSVADPSSERYSSSSYSYSCLKTPAPEQPATIRADGKKEDQRSARPASDTGGHEAQ